MVQLGCRQGAFYGCRSLTRITIPDSVTNIDDSAFWGCVGLESITISSSVTNIGDNAFYGCRSLRMVYYGGTLRQWINTPIGENNWYLENAQCYYYSKDNPYEESPSDTDLYWHYVDGIVTIWTKDN